MYILHNSFVGTLVLVLQYCYRDNANYGLLSKCLFQKSKSIAVEKKIKKKCQGNDEFLIKMSSSCQIEQKTFVDTNCINNIHTGEKVFTTAAFEGLCVVTFLTE